jgi:tetratricopeptide (TPR) repeat protein
MWNSKLIIALALCLVVGSAVLAQEEKWKELNQQARKLFQEGKYIEGIKIAENALNLAEKTFGPEDLNVAQSLNTLAELFFSHQGKYSNAEPLFKRSLEIYEKKLGPEDLNVATSLNFLACLYDDQRKYSNAEPL